MIKISHLQKRQKYHQMQNVANIEAYFLTPSTGKYATSKFLANNKIQSAFPPNIPSSPLYCQSARANLTNQIQQKAKKQNENLQSQPIEQISSFPSRQKIKYYSPNELTKLFHTNQQQIIQKKHNIYKVLGSRQNKQEQPSKQQRKLTKSPYYQDNKKYSIKYKSSHNSNEKKNYLMKDLQVKEKRSVENSKLKNQKASDSYKNMIESVFNTQKLTSPINYKKENVGSAKALVKNSKKLLKLREKKKSQEEEIVVKHTTDRKKYCEGINSMLNKSLQELRAHYAIGQGDNKQKWQCHNKDGKIAKYRIICDENNQNSAQIEPSTFYCSKCAIALLQKGFKIQNIVSDIQSPVPNNSIERQQFIRLKNLRMQIKNKIQIVQQQKCQLYQYFDEEIHDLDEYYRELIKNLERIRNKGKSTLIEIRQQIMKEPDQYLTELKNSFSYLVSKSNMPKLSSKQIGQIIKTQQLLHKKINQVKIQRILEQNLHEKIKHANELIQKVISLKICIPKLQKPLQKPQSPSIVRDNFSFGDLRNSKSISKQKKINSKQIFQTLQSLAEQSQYENSLLSSKRNTEQQPEDQHYKQKLIRKIETREQIKSAFRNLFPQESSKDNKFQGNHQK